jgi:hypothetical protein
MATSSLASRYQYVVGMPSGMIDGIRDTDPWIVVALDLNPFDFTVKSQ